MRLIDADRLTRYAIAFYTGDYANISEFAKVSHIINIAPAVDAVPVIRCRDCIHRWGDEYPVCMLHTEPYANAIGYKGEAVCVDMDDFCSYGTRKEENNA